MTNPENEFCIHCHIHIGGSILTEYPYCEECWSFQIENSEIFENLTVEINENETEVIEDETNNT